jgi:hypothetical protein
MAKSSVSPLSKLVQQVDNFPTVFEVNTPSFLPRDNGFEEAFLSSKTTLGLTKSENELEKFSRNPKTTEMKFLKTISPEDRISGVRKIYDTNSWFRNYFLDCAKDESILISLHKSRSFDDFCRIEDVSIKIQSYLDALAHFNICNEKEKLVADTFGNYEFLTIISLGRRIVTFREELLEVIWEEETDKILGTERNTLSSKQWEEELFKKGLDIERDLFMELEMKPTPESSLDFLEEVGSLSLQDYFTYICIKSLGLVNNGFEFGEYLKAHSLRDKFYFYKKMKTSQNHVRQFLRREIKLEMKEVSSNPNWKQYADLSSERFRSLEEIVLKSDTWGLCTHNFPYSLVPSIFLFMKMMSLKNIERVNRSDNSADYKFQNLIQIRDNEKMFDFVQQLNQRGLHFELTYQMELIEMNPDYQELLDSLSDNNSSTQELFDEIVGAGDYTECVRWLSETEGIFQFMRMLMLVNIHNRMGIGSKTDLYQKFREVLNCVKTSELFILVKQIKIDHLVTSKADSRRDIDMKSSRDFWKRYSKLSLSNIFEKIRKIKSMYVPDNFDIRVFEKKLGNHHDGNDIVIKCIIDKLKEITLRPFPRKSML